MLGAIIGDMVGSTRELKNIKTEDFEMLPSGSRFTDDTIMTLAVAEWLMKDLSHSKESLIHFMQVLGNQYPYAGYGGRFGRWLRTSHPAPYNSFGNGSAMRVSPIGLYAQSLEEVLELAKISAEVSHNHPEGIKGAQALAACIFLQKQNTPKLKIQKYLETKFGYDLHTPLENLRENYTFDVSCQGSVPIAIMAFLQRDHMEEALRLAISMGGDSDTIGCMTTSITCANETTMDGKSAMFFHEISQQCEQLLPLQLLDILHRFENFLDHPLYQSYSFYTWDKLFAGEYPGDQEEKIARLKLQHMHRFGIRHFIDLTEEGELLPYQKWLSADTTYLRFPILDCDVPRSLESVFKLISQLEQLSHRPGKIYLHCHGGVGRAGTIVACLIAWHEREYRLEEILNRLNYYFSKMPKSSYRDAPETMKQIEFIQKFSIECWQRTQD